MRALIIITCLFSFSVLNANEGPLRVKLGGDVEEVYFTDGSSIIDVDEGLVVNLEEIDTIFLKSGEMVTPEFAYNIDVYKQKFDPYRDLRDLGDGGSSGGGG